MTTVNSGGFRFSKFSVSGCWYWSVLASNTEGANQQYYIHDIQTPYGRITDGIDTPIPGDVVVEMASSLSQFQQQLSPLLALVSGQQTVYNVTVTQGDPSSSVGSINFLNAGAFGSFMTASASPTAPWLSASPTFIPGIGQNQHGKFDIILNPSILVTQTNPYAGSINLQDNKVPPTLVPITVNVTVLPQPIISVNQTDFQFSWISDNHANSGSVQLLVTNSGPTSSILGFTIAKVTNCSPWLTFSPVMFSDIHGGSSPAIITLSLVSQCVPQSPGTYFETLLIVSPNAQKTHVAVSVTLTVMCSGGYHVDKAVEWVGGDYDGGPGAPYNYGPGNQITPGPGNADPPAPGSFKKS